MSCRTGRIPLVSDPLCSAVSLADVRFNLKTAHAGMLLCSWALWYKLNHSHQIMQYKGPDNPFARIRHKRYPGGGLLFGWGNNGLNRDCTFFEHECWAGYQGKEYTY